VGTESERGWIRLWGKVGARGLVSERIKSDYAVVRDRPGLLGQEGYKWFFPNPPGEFREGKMLLVWSAPNYEYTVYTAKNDATVLRFRWMDGWMDGWRAD
jgi:hypothetical protein